MIALFNGNDVYHAATVAFIRANQSELVTTIASLTETLHLLNFSRNAQVDFLEWVYAGAVSIESIENADLPRIVELTKKNADLPANRRETAVYRPDQINLVLLVETPSDLLPKLPMKKNKSGIFSQ